MDPAAGTNGEPGAPERQAGAGGWGRWVETPVRKAVAIAVGLTALTGLATGGWELYDRAFPPALPVSATITPAETVEPDVPWELGRAHHPELGERAYTAEQLAAIGAVFTLGLHIKGQAGRTGLLRWRTVDKDGAELPMPPWAPTSARVRPASDDDHLTHRLWTPLPLGVEAFKVEFSFADNNDTTRETKMGPLVPVGVS